MVDRSYLNLAWARWYIGLGLKVFALAVDRPGAKKPTGNCPRCKPDDPVYVAHDLETCPCLLCHGFYAATADVDRVALMLEVLPSGFLAIRTGTASGVVVLDFESKDRRVDPDNRSQLLPSGLEILDTWELLNGWELPPTLTATSVSGGRHLFYALPHDVRIGQGTFIRDALDIKGEGGYVGVPSGTNGRTWQDTSVRIATAPAELVTLLSGPRGASGGYGGVPGSAGGGGALPPTEEFMARGLGWLTGSRNQDAYRLAFRLWAERRSESEVMTVLQACWDATADRSASSWSEIWTTALSARRRQAAQHDREVIAARDFLARWRAS
jgi:hypothetical protein